VETELAGLIPEVIVADIDLDFAIIYIRHMGADLVQEIPVMGDDDHCVLEAGEKMLQPVDGLQVQLVGWFVQKQDIRVTEQGLGQQHPHLVAAVKLLHSFLTHLFRDAEAA